MTVFISTLPISAGCSNMQTDKKSETTIPIEDEYNNNYEEAVVGGGCLWGIEGICEKLKGVKKSFASMVENGFNASGFVDCLNCPF